MWLSKYLISVLKLVSFVMQESNLLRLAEQQAKREEELSAARQRATQLEAELADLAREVELRQEQESALKEVCSTTFHLSLCCSWLPAEGFSPPPLPDMW